jgi:hypothetical protein
MSVRQLEGPHSRDGNGNNQISPQGRRLLILLITIALLGIEFRFLISGNLAAFRNSAALLYDVSNDNSESLTIVSDADNTISGISVETKEAHLDDSDIHHGPLPTWMSSTIDMSFHFRCHSSATSAVSSSIQ